MPPKKKPRNAFYIFMMEYKQKHENRGGRMSLEEAKTEAGVIWAKMNAQQRGPYQEMAKEEKIRYRHSEEKYTAQGVPFSVLEKEKAEKDAEERLIKKEIESTVRSAILNDALAEQKYFFIMANYFTKTVENGVFVPAEIALVEFSLKEGIINQFHSYVNPGLCMFGHAYDTQVHAENTHKLPLPPKAMGEKDLPKLYREILKFIQPVDGSKEYPPVYTHAESVPILKSVLDFLHSGEEDLAVIHVFPIHYLFYTLKKATAEKGDQKKPESVYVTDAVFDRDNYEYQSGISCDYHETVDASKFCALSCVIRWGYMFCDYMNFDLALPVVPGKHVPINADISAGWVKDPVVSQSDNFSVVSERTFISTTNESDLTHLKEEREDNTSFCISKDFPELGGSRRKDRFNQNKNDLNINADSEGSPIVSNPWSVRSRETPRPPSESSFNFASVVCGRGRGVVVKQEEPSTSARRGGGGRGRFFQNS